MTSSAPVFVAGLERSGTSLMYALLASHPNIAMTRRTNFWTYFADQYGDLAEPANLDACLAKMRQYKRIVKLQADFDLLRAEFAAGEPTYGRLYALLEEQVARREQKPRWGDKSLHIERYTDRLVVEYPGVRMLHMIRDPRDRFASVLARWKRRRGDVGAGTAEWVWSARLAARHATRYPDAYLPVRYESLVHDPEGELARICAFLGEPYSDDMLTMNGAERFRDEGANSSYGPRAAGAVSADSIGRYRQVLTSRQIAFIQRRAAKPMAQYGYLPDDLDMAPGERARFWINDWTLNNGVMVAWRARDAYRDVRGRRLPDYRLVEVPA